MIQATLALDLRNPHYLEAGHELDVELVAPHAVNAIASEESGLKSPRHRHDTEEAAFGIVEQPREQSVPAEKALLRNHKMRLRLKPPGSRPVKPRTRLEVRQGEWYRVIIISD